MAFSSDFDDDTEMSEINMTPLVDVMLVLLIIFMITVPVLTQSIDIELPRVGSTPSEVNPNTITLSVDANGDFFWNKEAVDPPVLTQRLEAAATKQPQPQVHIRGDQKTDYEHVVKLMASAQQAGLTQLGFITELSN